MLSMTMLRWPKSPVKQAEAPVKHPRSYHRVTENSVTRLHVLNVLGYLQYFSDPRATKDDGRLTMPVVELSCNMFIIGPGLRLHMGRKR